MASMSRKPTQGGGSRSQANLSKAMARADEAVLRNSSVRLHREVAILKGGTSWIAEAVPGRAAEVLGPIGPPNL